MLLSITAARVAALLLLPPALAAQAPAAATHTPAWFGSGQLSLAHHTASVNSFNASLGHLLKYARGGRSFTLATTYNSNSFKYEVPQSGGAVVKKVMRISSASIASHYRLTLARRNYWVTHAQWEHDRGQSIVRRVHGATGIGRNMLRTPARGDQSRHRHRDQLQRHPRHQAEPGILRSYGRGK